MRSTESPALWSRLGTIAAAALLMGATACGSTTSSGGSTAEQPPTANTKPPTSIGTPENQLNLIAWEGYTDDSWVKPFTAATGCVVNHKYAGSSDEMVSLMKNGGGGQYDMVSASGDADLRLIYSGDVKPMNTALIPDFNNFQTYFKAPAYNTINGIHYGISLQWGPNVLLYSTKKFPVAPTSWSAVYDPANKGLVTAYDYAITIADAALYLSKSKPSLGIKDPYELTKPQFDATIALLMQQRQLIKKYWGTAGDEINLFESGDVVIGAAWPYQTIQLKADASAFLWRDAGQHKGVRRDGGTRGRLVRPVPRRRAGHLLQHHPFLEDPDRHLRRRQQELHRLLTVAGGLDDDHRLAWR